MKKEIRSRVLNQLLALSKNEAEKKRQEKIILEKLFASDTWKKSKIIAVTLSMPQEFDTTPIIKQASIDKKVVGIPKTFAKGKMDFYEYKLGDDVTMTSFGVLEPVSDQRLEPHTIELVIVPGVAFSNDGYRIGFGGGFYDRYLAKLNLRTVSLVLEPQVQNELPIENHDIPVQTLIYSDRAEAGHVTL